MTTIYYEKDASIEALAGARVAVVGYGNQGRSWALNLRDSGLDVSVCVRADASREQAEKDGFRAGDVASANQADVLCVLIPDDVIPLLPLQPSERALTVLASGYTVAFDRFDPPGDIGMVAPRMLGPEVRQCYVEGAGFITAVGIHRDVTGTALARTLAIAKAIGGLREGAIEMTARQEAILDLAVEQVLSPALTHASGSFVGAMLEQGIPLEAVVTELVLSGEVERTYGLLRREGFAQQMEYHSPTSQYGQLSRRGSYDKLDFASRMRELVDDIVSGRFAEEWDKERDAGHPRLAALKSEHCGDAIREFEMDLRRRLGPGVRRS
ncbi:MAG: ketol-acid reductoisomerase [Deltaproteobacteria bacterium]|nr:ketol-acid reductoisomerase [Deltaproteobacteria bacterium]